jgi:2-polyprenyl-3-methyl-5-hydroxy-6-metoxy-1,4-benzoquinol methylase
MSIAEVIDERGARVPPDPHVAKDTAPAGQPPGTYTYYFESERPGFVTRLIARKHRRMHSLATAGRRVERVLEIGPGEGMFASAARSAGNDYTAVESSPEGARQLREAGFEVIQGTVPPLPEGLERVDLVYAAHVIEHLAGPNAAREFVEGSRDLLRPGGALALAFPDASRIGADFWDCDYTHQWPSTPRRVRQLARDAGFRVVATHHCCLHLTGWRARLLSRLMRMFPARSLGAAMPDREDFWYRGKMLFAPDVLMVLEPDSSVGSRQAA